MKSVYRAIPRMLCLGIPLTMYLLMLNMEPPKLIQNVIEIPKYVPGPPVMKPEIKLFGSLIRLPQHLSSYIYIHFPFYGSLVQLPQQLSSYIYIHFPFYGETIQLPQQLSSHRFINFPFCH
jgi:hypothetical protein